MSTRACPYCGETIQEVAKLCRFCKEPLGEGPRAAAAAPKKASTAVIVIVVIAGACTLLGVPAIIAAIAIPNLIEARKSGNESSAIGSLKAITTAQTMFQQGDKDRDGDLQFGTLADLGASQHGSLIDSVLASGRKTGYQFVVGLPANRRDRTQAWAAAASPWTPGTTGDRFFGVDEAGAIYVSLTSPFGVDDGVLTKPADAQLLGSGVRRRR